MSLAIPVVKASVVTREGRSVHLRKTSRGWTVITFNDGRARRRYFYGHEARRRAYLTWRGMSGL